MLAQWTLEMNHVVPLVGGFLSVVMRMELKV